MAANDKAKLLEILARCSEVIDGEIDLLDRWSLQATSAGRAGRCVSRRAKVQSGPRVRMDELLARAQATPANAVKTSPTKQHESLVRPNESSIKQRSTWSVNRLSDPMFGRALDRAVENSGDAVKDGTAIFADVTR